jgi:DNA repair ATPase RecN
LLKQARELLKDTSNLFSWEHEQSELIRSTRQVYVELWDLSQQVSFDPEELERLTERLRKLYVDVIMERSHEQGKMIVESILLVSGEMNDLVFTLDNLEGRVTSDKLDSIFVSCLDYAFGE